MSARRIEVHGHRGARGLLPENTIPAFEHAIELGVDALELDVVMTRDGIPVVHHDRALDPDRTRDARGMWLAPSGPCINTLDLNALSEFDVGRSAPDSEFGKCFPEQAPRDGTHIPTLSEVLALGRRPEAAELRFSIEVKTTPLAPGETAQPGAFAHAVIAALGAENMIDRADILSFDWRVLAESRKLAPGLPIVCLSVEQPWLDNVLRGDRGPSPWTAGLDIEASGGSVPRMVKAAGSGAWGPFYRDLTRETLAEAHSLGLKVLVWSVNEVDEMLTLARMGVDGITTDYPNRAMAALAPWRTGK